MCTAVTINLMNIGADKNSCTHASRAIWESWWNQVLSLITIFFTVLPYSQHCIGTRKRLLQSDTRVQTLISGQTADLKRWDPRNFIFCATIRRKVASLKLKLNSDESLIIKSLRICQLFSIVDVCNNNKALFDPLKDLRLLVCTCLCLNSNTKCNLQSNDKLLVICL